jgi:hypothetical protein
MGDDVSIDIEASVVTLLILRPDPPAQSFKGAHRGRIYMCVFIGVSICACI